MFSSNENKLPGSFDAYGVLRNLSSIVPSRSNFDSTREQIKEISIINFIFQTLNDYWDTVEVNAPGAGDFYADSMLGYTTCEYVSDNCLSILSSGDEDDENELIDQLMKYLHFNHMHRGFGDITKRIVSAISSVAYNSREAFEILNAQIVLMQTESNFEWFEGDPCNSIDMEIHDGLYKELFNILNWVEENRTN